MTLASAERAEWSAPRTELEAEAARYALLRRLAPSMRHHLVVNLQPIGMIYEVMERRLRASEPDLASIHDSAHKINGFARAALNSCLDVVSWLAPEEGSTSQLHEGVRECASLLATSLGFRGYALRNEVDEVAGRVSRSAIRNMLTASLIHVTDSNAAPADLVLRAEGQPRGARLEIVLNQTEGGRGFANEAGYRALGWDDVQALAASEGVEVRRGGTREITLVIPWVSEAA